MEGTIILFDKDDNELARRHYNRIGKSFSIIEDWKIDYPSGHHIHFLPETKELPDNILDRLFHKQLEKKRKNGYFPKTYSIPKPTRISFYRP